MIPIKFDISGRNAVPPQISSLYIDNVQVADFRGNNYPETFPALIDTGSKYCVLPEAMLDILKPTHIKDIRARGYQNGVYITHKLYKFLLTMPPDDPVRAYGIFVDTDEILIGRTALKDYLAHVNFATGKGDLRIVP